MGTDLDVVNVARVSFAKESEWEYQYTAQGDRSFEMDFDIKDSDKTLITYLAKHGHWSPFAHNFLQIHMKIPIFVARQLVKHQVGLSWNEMSRRYVDDPPEFYFPEHWRKRADNVKQGSSEEIVPKKSDGSYFLVHVCSDAKEGYKRMIEDYNIAPEQARMILPQNTYTEVIWSGSMYAFARVCNQRLDSHAQKETQEVAKQIDDICKPLWPVSWSALVKNPNE